MTALLPVAGWGQTARISGTVLDGCADPLPHSLLTLVSSGSTALVATAQTNEDGEFFFPLVEVGAYDVQFESPGWKPARWKVPGGTEGEITIHITLDPREFCFTSRPLIPLHKSALPSSLEVWSSSEGRPAIDGQQIHSVCEVAANPFYFRDRMITLRGRIQIGFEDFEISAEHCAEGQINAIWLEYGRGPKRQPTVWCCGDMVPDDSLWLKQDSEFRRFHRDLTAKKKTKECASRDCYRFDVTATLAGRFESVLTVICPDGKSVCPRGAGYGHLGTFSSRFVIHQVSDIDAKPK